MLNEAPMPWRKWPGKIKKHSTMLAANTVMTTMGRATRMSPIRPDSIRIGKNAAWVVRVAAITGVSMRVAARSAAVPGLSPRVILVAACSPTTMASSTMIPRVKISANSDTILIDWPVDHISAKVASIATGMPSATQKAMRALRNTNSTNSTSTSPPRPLRTNREMRSFNRLARTSYFDTFRVGGRVGSTLTR